MNIGILLKKHKLWLESDEGGERADMSGADLSGADLSSADLRGADLRGADLRSADLRDANLRDANLSSADMSGADMSDADLSSANLRRANLSSADLSGADLSSANLSGADLSSANLSSANLSSANLSSANLSSANLSDAKGLLQASEWMAKNFKKTKLGYVVFKRIKEGETPYSPPSAWIIAPDKYITEVPNSSRADTCGCGVNFGTQKYCDYNNTNADLWECLLEWADLADLCVPYNTDGKARCARLKLIKKI